MFATRTVIVKLWGPTGTSSNRQPEAVRTPPFVAAVSERYVTSVARVTFVQTRVAGPVPVLSYAIVYWRGSLGPAEFESTARPTVIEGPWIPHVRNM